MVVVSGLTGPVTLGDLIRGDKLLWVYCTACGHERDVSPKTVPLPAEISVPDISKHMKCSVCGSRKINTKPELYPGGIIANRKR
jgi:cytochrome c1